MWLMRQSQMAAYVILYAEKAMTVPMIAPARISYLSTLEILPKDQRRGKF